MDSAEEHEGDRLIRNEVTAGSGAKATAGGRLAMARYPPHSGLDAVTARLLPAHNSALYRGQLASALNIVHYEIVIEYEN